MQCCWDSLILHILLFEIAIFYLRVYIFVCINFRGDLTNVSAKTKSLLIGTGSSQLIHGVLCFKASSNIGSRTFQCVRELATTATHSATWHCASPNHWCSRHRDYHASRSISAWAAWRQAGATPVVDNGHQNDSFVDTLIPKILEGSAFCAKHLRVVRFVRSTGG